MLIKQPLEFVVVFTIYLAISIMFVLFLSEYLWYCLFSGQVSRIGNYCKETSNVSSQFANSLSYRVGQTS